MIKKPFFLSLFLIIYHVLFSQSTIYIYTDKNILPGDELKVQVSGYNLSSDVIYFEIYRLKEPLKFATSKIEFLNFNDDFFNQSANQFELIKSFSKKINLTKTWFVETIATGKIFQKGTYLVRATTENKYSYSFFNCSEIGIISKRSIDDVIIFVSNRKTSQPLANKDLYLISLDKKIYSLKTNENGVATKSIDNRPEDRRFFVVTNDNDTTLLLPEIIYSPSDDYDKFLVYTYTNQPVYRPGQKVFFKSIIRERKNDELVATKNFNVRVKILMPDNSVLFDSNYTTNNFGSLHGSVPIPVDAPVGSYTILVEIIGMNFPSSFYVEEYKKPEYQVKIETDKNSYSPEDSVIIKIKADYFFGKPVQTGKVKFLIYRKPLIKYWWEFEPYANFYRGCFVDIIPHFQPELLLENEGQIENGEFNFSFKIDKTIDKNYEYQVVAYVKDETNREVQGSTQFLVSKNKIYVTTNPDRYVYTINSKIILKVITTDLSFKPVRKKFIIITHRVHYINYAEFYEDVDTLKGETQSDGIAYVSYSISKGGKYSYTVIVDDDDKKIIARNEFFVGDKEIKFSGLREGLQIIPAKDVFDEADELEFLIISVFKDVNVFVTLEQSKIYDYKVIKLNGNSTIVRFDTKLPSIAHISAGYYFENQFFNAIKKFGIISNQQKLNIEIISDKNIYKPHEKGTFKIKVKDYLGNPVKNVELSSSIIDESIFSIKSEQSENIVNVFNTSSIYKILTTTTELPYFYERFDNISQQIISYTELQKKGKAKIAGIVLDATSLKPISKIEVKLIREKEQLITSTDEKGNFIISKIPAGTYDLIIDNPAYLKWIKKSIRIYDGEYIHLGKIGLIPIATQVFPVFYDGLIKREMMILSKQSEDFVSPGILEKQNYNLAAQFKEVVIRRDFKDAIFWNANLLTDENGEVLFNVKFPDNLTSWRNSVKAITIDSKVGELISNVVVRKDLLIRVETPRYVHEKDEVILPVLIHNYSANKQTIKLEFDIKNGMIVSDFNERMHNRIYNPDLFTIKPDEVLKTKIKIFVNEDVDTLVFIAKALVEKTDNLNIESDAVEVKIPVEPVGYPKISVKNMSLSKETDKYQTQIVLNNNKKNLKVTLKLNSSLLGNLLSSLDELVGYPYGCVEQTMSRFLPSIIVANLIQELNIELKTKTLEELPEIVLAGLRRLKDFQHFDGGWGWWKEDNTNPYMTAYVLYGLTLTKKAGYPVEDGMIKNGIKAIKNILENEKIDENTRAYLLFSYNEALEFADMDKLNEDIIKTNFEQLKKFDNNPYILSMILQIAVKNGYENEISILSNKLLKTAINEGNLIYWRKANNSERLIDDKIEITSNAIRSLLMSGVKSEKIENAIRWLVYQKKGNLWMSTKQTASVIFSLTEYIKISNDLSSDFNVKIKLNNREIGHLRFDKTSIKSGEFEFVINKNEMKEGINIITIEKVGKGKLYISLIEKYFTEVDDEEQKYFEVERKYYKISYEKDNDKFIRKLSEIKDEVKVGDRILVELKVKAKNSYEYFMIEDPMIPGFERLEESQYQNGFLDWFYHKESRDKKTTFFQTYFNEGEFTFSYLTYAQIPGTYTIPPAIASLMYYPDLSGSGEERVIKIIE